MTKVPDQKNSLLQCFQNEQFEMVFVFYAGLTGLKRFNVAKLFRYINEQDHRIRKYLFSKVVYFVINAFQKNCGTWLLFNNKIEESNAITPEYNEHRMSVLIACCAEAKNPAVCRAFSNSDLFRGDICTIYFFSSTVTSQLLSSLSYCIAYSGKKWCLTNNNVLSEQDVMSLQKHLIDANDITGKLVALQSQINNSNVMHLFVERYLQPHSTLGSLDLFGSTFEDDDCITILLRLNGSLIILHLTCCNISSKGTLTIAEMLRYNNTLQYINLEGIKFAIKALIKFLQMIESNTTLRMMEIDESLFFNKQIKEQLGLFNKNRKNQLMLYDMQKFIFGDAVSKLW